MRYSTISLVALAWCIATLSPALPQPAATTRRSPATAPLETVIVTGQKVAPMPRAVIDKFVTSHIAPTLMVGKIARWAAPVCPRAIGLNPEGNATLEQRIRDVAIIAGATADANPRCQPNITVIFTATPQALLDEIAADHPYLLGYHAGPIQAEQLAKVIHPIQAWYATGTKDAYGVTQADDNDNNEGQVPPERAIGSVPPKGEDPMTAEESNTPSVPYFYTNGFTLDDGISSSFANILIVADRNKVGGYSFSAASDYIAMLALSQTKTSDTCGEPPSILNLMAQACDAQWKASALTASDITYLRGLYKMEPTTMAHIQKYEIGREMEKELDGQ